MAPRGLTSVVGIALLTLVTVALAAVLLGGLTAVEHEAPPRTSFDVAADASADRVAVTHAGGDAIDPAAVSLHLAVEDEPLARQPPVPFFSADGFVSGPTGPFNPAWRGNWTAGETATLRIAETNAPSRLEAGDTVTVIVRVDGRPLSEQEVAAR